MTFNEWLVKIMATRLVIRIAMDPRPGKSDYSALLVGSGDQAAPRGRSHGWLRPD